MAASKDEVKYSDREVKCDYCENPRAHMYTIETAHCEQVVSACAQCRAAKVVEEKAVGFKKWLWPKDAATYRKELSGK